MDSNRTAMEDLLHEAGEGSREDHDGDSVDDDDDGVGGESEATTRYGAWDRDEVEAIIAARRTRLRLALASRGGHRDEELTDDEQDEQDHDRGGQDGDDDDCQDASKMRVGYLLRSPLWKSASVKGKDEIVRMRRRASRTKEEDTTATMRKHTKKEKKHTKKKHTKKQNNKKMKQKQKKKVEVVSSRRTKHGSSGDEDEGEDEDDENEEEAVPPAVQRRGLRYCKLRGGYTLPACSGLAVSPLQAGTTTSPRPQRGSTGSLSLHEAGRPAAERKGSPQITRRRHLRIAATKSADSLSAPIGLDKVIREGSAAKHAPHHGAEEPQTQSAREGPVLETTTTVEGVKSRKKKSKEKKAGTKGEHKKQKARLRSHSASRTTECLANLKSSSGEHYTSSGEHDRGGVETGRRRLSLLESLANLTVLRSNAPRPRSSVRAETGCAEGVAYGPSYSNEWIFSSSSSSPSSSPVCSSPEQRRRRASLLSTLAMTSFLSPSSSPSSSRRSSSSTTPTAYHLDISDREREEIIGTGDPRLYCLLRELRLEKYWLSFLQQEILIEDVVHMNEEELVADFHFGKYHARRLVNVFKQNDPLLQDLMNFYPLASPLLASSGDKAPSSSPTSVTIASASFGPPQRAIRRRTVGALRGSSEQKVASAKSFRNPSRKSADSFLLRKQGFTDIPGEKKRSSFLSGSSDQKVTLMNRVRSRSVRSSKHHSDGASERSTPTGQKDLSAHKSAHWVPVRGDRTKALSHTPPALSDEEDENTKEKELTSAEQRMHSLESNDKLDTEEDRLLALMGKHRELDTSDLEWDEELGIIASGMFGNVFKGKWRGVDCAIKELKCVPLKADQRALVIKQFRREASLMQALGHHPNCICFFGAVTNGSKLYLVTEWAKNGSVYDLLIKKRVVMPLESILRLARDAACGVLHLHSENVIHRDIAARNVLVGDNFVGKISDLGLSRMVSGVTASLRNYTNSSIGAVKWMSPESIQTGLYSEKSDAYSFGVFLWEMWTREQPWDDLPPLQAALQIAGGTQLTIPDDCPCDLADLIRRCLSFDPKDRPNFSVIVQELDAMLIQMKAPALPPQLPYIAESQQDSSRQLFPQARDIQFTHWKQRMEEECKRQEETNSDDDHEDSEESTDSEDSKHTPDKDEMDQLVEYHLPSILIGARG